MTNEQERAVPIIPTDTTSSALNASDASNNLSATPSIDPADEIPVPIAMSPAEIDERAQAVEAVRGTSPLPTDGESTDSDASLNA